MNKSKVLVIGGGPAGSSAAYFLAKAGIDVTLLDKDKWPRDKACGGGLSTACLELLADMDLLDEMEARADVKFNRYVVYAPDGEALRAGVSRRSGNKAVPADHSFVVRRSVFDQMLSDKAAAAGAHIVTKIKANDIRTGETPAVITENGKTFQADILVVADGSGGAISRKLKKHSYKEAGIAIRGYYSGIKGLGKDLEFFQDDGFGFGYGWVFPLSDGLANVGFGIGTPFLKKRNTNIHQLLDNMLSGPALKSRMKNAKLEGKLSSFPLQVDYDKNGFRQGRVLFAGDAASLIFPLSGEGIAYALKSGKIAAEAIAAVYRNNAPEFSCLAQYETECRKTFKDFKQAIRLVELLGQPKVQHFFFSSASYNKKLGQRAISLLEHSTRVTTPASLSILLQSIWVAIKRKFTLLKT